MKTFSDFWNFIIISNENLNLTVSDLIILIVGIAVLYALNKITTYIIRKSAFITKLNIHLQKVICRTIGFIIWIVGLIGILRLEHVNTNQFFDFIIFDGDKVDLTVRKVFVFIIVIFIIRIVVNVVDLLMNRRIKQDNLDEGKLKSVVQIAKYIIWTVGLLMAIGVIGLKLTFIIASVSALLVGVGFGLQNIFNDFFSGIIILFDGTIKVHDVVELDDVVGRVTEIGIRTTKVLTRENIVLIIPNSKFTADRVINWSHMEQKSRFDVSVGVEYGSDVQLVRQTLLDAAKEAKRVDASPAPFVRFEDFGDSSLDFTLYFWTNDNFLVENIKSDLRFIIDRKFRENKITIPFPQRDLHLKSDFRK